MTDPGNLLLRATYDGVPVIVTHATAAEVKALEGKINLADDEFIREALELWSLISIRDERSAHLHIVGWRAAFANTSVTTQVRKIDLREDLVRTRSGTIFRLGVGDKPEVHAELQVHLKYALRALGFDNVL